MDYLTGKDFEALREKYEEAYYFLLKANLINEREKLESELNFLQKHGEYTNESRKKWVENRLRELATL